MKKLEVKCPQCNKKFNYYSSEFRPFCCERCRLIDFGQWMSESYSVPAHKLSDEEVQSLEQLVHEKNKDENDSY